MFDKLKMANKFRQMQGQMKKEIEQIYYKEEDGDTFVVLRGDKRIDELVIDGQARKDLKDFLNKALKGLDKKVEKQMKNHAGDIGEMFGL